MYTEKPIKLTQVNFVESANLKEIPFQLGKACRRLMLTLAGSITITSQTGTITPTILPSADGSQIWPYLLSLFGSITFQGSRTDSGKGLKIENIPLSMLWLESFILNKGIPPVVDDGGMANANFVPGTYNISVNVPINFFDPRSPQGQHQITYFRPPCYNKQPFFQIVGGTLFEPNYLANIDNVALTGDTTVPSTLVYTTNLKVSATAYTVPSLAISSGDDCADVAYEYIPLMNVTQAGYNGINLSDNELQMYMTAINTNRAVATGAGASLVEAGIDTMGNALQGLLQTFLGADPVINAYANNVKADDYEEFMTSISAWPAGVITFDMYGHNWKNSKNKTFLAKDAPQFNLGLNGVPGASGSNLRILHKTANMSAVTKRKIGTFGPYDGD